MTCMNELEEKLSAVLGFIDVYERAERELTRTLALLDEIEQEIKTCKAGKHQIKSARKRIRELKVRIAETVTRRQRLEKLVELKRAIYGRRMTVEAASKALQTARDELNKLESVHLEVCQRIIQNTDASRKVKMKMREEEAHYQKELKHLEQMYSCLRQSAEYYDHQLLNAIQLSSTSQLGAFCLLCTQLLYGGFLSHCAAIIRTMIESVVIFTTERRPSKLQSMLTSIVNTTGTSAPNTVRQTVSTITKPACETPATPAEAIVLTQPNSTKRRGVSSASYPPTFAKNMHASGM
ncbi:hypothetical protein PsorP6_013420 [Peronosclerospora sorghi]|uniref:Uncharacterized protein n=1 Tax=Peronosclerospora sorghi TaxID=230839 RepID=A0ACC0VHN4_9STRA|nr:hypothetical protein PsorP6_013420 [Peronosclerospora sorghi]